MSDRPSHPRRTLTAYRAYLLEAGVSSLARSLIYTVLAVYYVRSAGLSPFQLVIVGTTLEAACFLFQIPTGVIADLRSRRLSIAVGEALVGICFLIEGSFPIFAVILFAEVIRGVGETCIDGALQAWIADEHGEEGLERVFLRGGQIGAATGIAGPLAAVGLATVDLRLPILLGGGLLVALGGIVLLAMPETRFTPVPRDERGSIRAALGSMTATTRDAARIARGRPLLLMLLVVAAVTGAASEGYDRLWEAQFLTAIGLPRVGGWDPVVWFGIFGSAGAVVGIVLAEVANRRLTIRDDATSARLLFGLSAVSAGGIVVFALAPGFGVALIAFWVVNLARTLSGPLYNAWLNRQIASAYRATMFSAAGQADAVGQLAGGPAIGAIGSLFGIRAAIAAAGLLLAPACWLYARARRPVNDSPV